MSILKSKRMWGLLLLSIIISTGVLFTDAFRDDDFCHYDAPFYSTIAQNILRSGDWVNLTYHEGIPFENDHPPLTFWMTALSLKVFGENVFSTIFFSLLCGLGTCITVFFIGTILKNDIVGFLSGIGLLLTRYVPRVARFNTIEIPLMFFVSLAVLFLILAHKKHKSFYILFGISTGLAVLTKGVIGFFPLGICFFTVILQKKFKDFLNPFFITGLLITLAVPLTWFFFKGGQTLKGAWGDIHGYMEFVLSTFRSSKRTDPDSRLRLFTKLFEICFIIMPGVLLGLYHIVKSAFPRHSESEGRRISITIPIWAIIFLTAFTLSSWRRGFYLLPMYPAMAVLFGIGIYEIIPKTHKMTVVYLASIFFIGNISGPFLFPHWEPKNIQEVVFKNTYLPGFKKAVKELYRELPQNTELSAYGLRDQEEFLFFFSSDYAVKVYEELEDFEKLVFSETPVLIYIPKEEFSRLDKKLIRALRIVYAAADKLIVTNQPDLTPAFTEK
ncbi:MAG: glycosyltransferase family 39 protein [Candidatus Omnitrophota bacterium]